VSERRTIRERTAIEGDGLHLGQKCRLAFLPAPPGTGILFRRVDLPGTPETPAHADRAIHAERRTQLGDGDGALHTVEHVLAAIVGSGIDDIIIEMDSAEPPIRDGSAKEFLDKILAAGVVGHGGTADELRVTECVRVVDGESVYTAHPSPCLELDVSITFDHPLVGTQTGKWRISEGVFASELAGARTFGMVRDLEALQLKGLVRGVAMENTLGLGDDGSVSSPLQWPDEFVRHKALDLVGDLALAGKRVKARISAVKPSHRGTLTFVRELLAHSKREGRVIDIEEIMRVLPHRYPFLLVDRILEFEEKKRVVGIKNVTINEPFFQGHFPGHPVMPGVLIIEAMAQVGGVLLMGNMADDERRVVYIMSLDNVKFRRPVRPGDQLRTEVTMMQIRGQVCRVRCVATVDGEVACEADVAAMVRTK
jgi:UDP-3-O-[3-hydroxymyristoyl] N-acetylglucosamine deacetylase / 3-hydroxyacyl-[acyl-carrier-protein] dehydratase